MKIISPIWKTISFLFHLVMIVIFMEIAEMILVAHATRIWVYSQLFVQLGGVVVYLILLYLIKRAFRK